MIVSLFPELETHGGIQRLGRHVALAQVRAARERGMETRFLSLNDPAGTRTLEVAGEQITYLAFGGNKPRFSLAALRAARHARLLHIGHVFLSPLVFPAKTFHKKLVTHVHVFGIDVWNRRGSLQRAALRRSDWIVSISEHTLTRMSEVQDVKPRRSAIIFPPLDPSFIGGTPPFDQALSAIHGKRFLLTVSRLATTEKFKGIRTAIDAFARIADQHPDVHYVIAGGGNDLENLREYVGGEHGLAHRVHLPGRLPDETLRWLYANCDAFVLPSSKEGFGIVFLEAMAFEKPCVGGNTGGTPEIVVDDETGFLVPWDDVSALAKVMDKLLSDDYLRARLGHAGHRRLLDVFTFDTFSRQMARLIDDSLQGTQNQTSPQRPTI